MYLSSLLIDVGLNPDRPRPGRLWLRNLYRVHQRLCMGFPYPDTKAHDRAFLKPYQPCGFRDPRPVYCAWAVAQQPPPCATVEPQPVHVPRDTQHNFLFRVDPQPGGRVVILVQSAVEPDWDYAFHNVGYLLAADCRSFDPCFAKEQVLPFRLVANPTKKIGTIRKAERQSCAKEELKERKGRHGRRVPVPTDQLYEWLARRGESCGFSIERDSTTVQPSYIYVKKTRNGNGQRLRCVRYDGILKVADPGRLQETVVQGLGPGKAFGFGLLSVAPLRASLPAGAR